jgi:hypothetical protein
MEVIRLSRPFEGLVNLVNVSSPVGPGQPNTAEDVKVVQNLLHGVALARSGRVGLPAPQITGHFDASTGFWIFYLQSALRAGGAGVIDGIVSPARGGAHFGGTPFFIAHLNDAANKANKTAYDRFVVACSVGIGRGTFSM